MANTYDITMTTVTRRVTPNWTGNSGIPPPLADVLVEVVAGVLAEDEVVVALTLVGLVVVLGTEDELVVEEVDKEVDNMVSDEADEVVVVLVVVAVVFTARTLTLVVPLLAALSESPR